MLLDINGGPNHVGNFCDAPILVNTETKEVLFQSSFYYIGHFSRFVTPGSKRLGTKIRPFMIPAAPDGRIADLIEAASFVTPEGKTVVVILNRTEDDVVFELNFLRGAENDKNVKMQYSAKVSEQNSERSFICPARAIQTYIFE